MKHLAKQASLLAVSLIAALSLAVVPVGAEHGTGSGDSSTPNALETENNTTPESGGSGKSGKAAITKTETETEAVTDTSATEHTGKLRDDARLLLQAKRQNTKERTKAERQKACTLRRSGIDKRTTAYGTAAQRHLDVFNKIFTKVQAFQTSKQLTVSNYDTLVAAATAKQTAAQTAVDALKALDVQIDCTQADPAGAIATVKTAVSNARTALQDYRTAIKNLILALKAATITVQNAPTGGDQ